MTAVETGPAAKNDDEKAILAFASALMRWRRPIIALGLLGGIVGGITGLVKTRLYKASATFIPQSSESGLSGLALAAGQLGIRVPSGNTTWGPPLYVEMLRSRALLEPIARESVTVAEHGGRRVAMMELLEVPEGSEVRRLDRAVRRLQSMVRSGEVRPLAAVQLSVFTPWPSVSVALVERLVRGVNEFNVATRKSQAVAERQFVEAQAQSAEENLRAAEERLQRFRERNRVVSAPELQTEHDRLQREVTLRQQLYTGLMQNREEARIREVRDTPVITVIEGPRLPIEGEARGTVRRGLLGGILGGLIGVLIAIVAQTLRRLRGAPDEEAREFLRLIDEATPRFMRGRAR